jgi:hypothetical protein
MITILLLKRLQVFRGKNVQVRVHARAGILYRVILRFDPLCLLIVYIMKTVRTKEYLPFSS